MMVDNVPELLDLPYAAHKSLTIHTEREIQKWAA